MSAEPEWGVDSEHGRLLDVLVCPPDNFRWLPTSAISRATLEAGHRFDADLAARQHAEMVAAYEAAGVGVHRLEPDPALPYQVFARDSSAMTQGGAVIGAGEARTQEQAAAQLAAWMAEDGWDVRVEPIPERFVHIDVLIAVLAKRLVAVCAEALSGGVVAWLRDRGFELIEVSAEDAFDLGANAISLGAERVLSIATAESLNAAMRAHGLTVQELDLSMFTLGGGGAHCLAQALRRERVG